MVKSREEEANGEMGSVCTTTTLKGIVARTGIKVNHMGEVEGETRGAVRSQGEKREGGFIKLNKTRDKHTIRGKIERQTLIGTMSGRVTEKKARMKPRNMFVGIVGS